MNLTKILKFSSLVSLPANHSLGKAQVDDQGIKSADVDIHGVNYVQDTLVLGVNGSTPKVEFAATASTANYEASYPVSPNIGDTEKTSRQITLHLGNGSKTRLPESLFFGVMDAAKNSTLKPQVHNLLQELGNVQTEITPYFAEYVPYTSSIESIILQRLSQTLKHGESQPILTFDAQEFNSIIFSNVPLFKKTQAQTDINAVVGRTLDEARGKNGLALIAEFYESEFSSNFRHELFKRSVIDGEMLLRAGVYYNKGARSRIIDFEIDSIFKINNLRDFAGTAKIFGLEETTAFFSSRVIGAFRDSLNAQKNGHLEQSEDLSDFIFSMITIPDKEFLSRIFVQAETEGIPVSILHEVLKKIWDADLEPSIDRDTQKKLTLLLSPMVWVDFLRFTVKILQTKSLFQENFAPMNAYLQNQGSVPEFTAEAAFILFSRDFGFAQSICDAQSRFPNQKINCLFNAPHAAGVLHFLNGLTKAGKCAPQPVS